MHCYNCGAQDHWAHDCPELSSKQQVQLHMNVQGKVDTKEFEEGHQLLNVSLMQGETLPDKRAYLDGCSTVTAFTTDKYLRNLEMVEQGIKINCNAGVVTTNQKGTFGQLNVWYVLNRITNIFFMHKLKQKYPITYDSWVGYYLVHTPKGIFKFHKDKQGLPYIDLEGLSQKAATMLMQVNQAQGAQECASGAARIHVQMVCGNYEGYTKQEIVQAKQARKAQAMIGNPSKKDFRGMVTNHLVANCPVTHANITNACQIFGLDLASIRG